MIPSVQLRRTLFFRFSFFFFFFAEFISVWRSPLRCFGNREIPTKEYGMKIFLSLTTRALVEEIVAKNIYLM